MYRGAESFMYYCCTCCPPVPCRRQTRHAPRSFSASYGNCLEFKLVRLLVSNWSTHGHTKQLRRMYMAGQTIRNQVCALAVSDLSWHSSFAPTCIHMDRYIYVCWDIRTLYKLFSYVNNWRLKLLNKKKTFCIVIINMHVLVVTSLYKQGRAKHSNIRVYLDFIFLSIVFMKLVKI